MTESLDEQALRIAKEIPWGANLAGSAITEFARRLRAELSKGQEPVAWISNEYLQALIDGEEGYARVFGNETMNSCIPLYASPIAQEEWMVMLQAAAQEFIDKCDRGEARSKRSYKALKEALAMLAASKEKP